jgi:hypothetical protein
MANWAWPHTPDSIMARVILRGGPFDGEQVGFLPPDTAAPAQIIWTGWFPWGFTAYQYEWRGETEMDRGRTSALIYRPPIYQNEHLRVSRGRRVPLEEIPPGLADSADLWSDGAALIVAAYDVPADMIWPGV